MATKEEVLEILAAESGPISRPDLASKLGTDVSNIASQLKRWEKQGLITKNESEELTLTEEGKEEATKPKVPVPSKEEVPKLSKELSEDALGATEYQRFKYLGKKVGVPGDLIDITTDHVWNGGDFRDINWVWEAMGQMGIRPDLKPRWCNAWRTDLGQPIPVELEKKIAKESKESGVKTEQEGEEEKRDYILIDDMPVRVGANLGDFDKQTAVDLAGVRALRGRFSQAAPSAPVQPPQPVEQRLPELITALAAFKEKPDQENVNALLKELQDAKFDNLKQDIRSMIPQPQQQQSFMEQLAGLFTSLGSLKEMGPTIRGILGIPEQRQESQTSNMVPIDKDGNPMVNFDSLINWKRFLGEERRADERHDELKGLVKTVKEVLPDGVAAIRDTASQMKTGSKLPTSGQTQAQGTVFQCPHCKQSFTPDLSQATIKCPNPECGAEWDKSSIVGA